MLRSTRLKKRLKQIILWLPGFLLLFGCFYVFIGDNLISFIFSLWIPAFFFINLIIGGYYLLKKSWYSLMALCGTVVYFFCFDFFVQFNDKVPVKEHPSINTLSILSYNTNGFNNEAEGKRYIDEAIADFIKKKNADVFCIQEFSAIRYKLFREYPHFFKTNRVSGPHKSVMAIFSKYPIKDEGYIDFPNSNNGAMYVDIDIKGEVVRVYNIHLQSFKVPIGFYDFSEARSYNSIISRVQKAERIRKKQATLMKDHIENFKGKIILCGDFNTTQFSSPYNLLKGSKKDSFIEAGNGLGSTFSLYGYPFRLDYILADESFNVLSHENFELNLSDHEPILVELGMD